MLEPSLLRTSRSHWSDGNRKDVWYVALNIAVEANNNVFNDFNSAANPSMRADHGGLFLVVYIDVV